MMQPGQRKRFIWGSSDVIKGKWYLGLFCFYDQNKAMAVSVRGLLRWAAVLAVLAWLAAGTAVWSFWDRSPYNRLTLTDALLYPARRDSIREKKGQAAIAEAVDQAHRRNWSAALPLLRQGLTWFPDDQHARLLLAQFYASINHWPAAEQLLHDRLPAEYPGRNQLNAIFDLATSGEDYAFIVDICNRYLPLLGGPDHLIEYRWLMGRKFSALLSDDHPAEALAACAALPPSQFTSEQKVRALRDLHRYDEALAELDVWQGYPLPDMESISRLRIQLLCDTRRFDEMQRVIDTWLAQNGSDPKHAAFAVAELNRGGQTPAAQAALDRYIFRFGGDSGNLLNVAEPLQGADGIQLVDQCAAAAAERGYNLEPFQVLQVQARMSVADWAAAARLFAAVSQTHSEFAKSSDIWREWTRDLLDVVTAANTTGPTRLTGFLQSRSWPMRIHRRTIEALRRSPDLDTARAVTAIACAAYPASRWLRQQNTEIAVDLAARATQTAAAASTAVDTSNKLPAEKVFFARLDSAVKNESWNDAAALLDQARRERPIPNWIEAHDADLRYAEMTVGRGQNDAMSVVTAARLLLDGTQPRSAKVTDFAKSVFDGGDHQTALTLVTEVLRKTPAYIPAQKLRTAWEPKPEKKAEKK